MPLLSWFSKKPANEDYEQVLASLALSIQKRQTKLSEIRLRERRATLLVTTWAFAAWAAYVGLWWAGFVGGSRRGSGVLWGVPVVLGPLVILFTRRLVQLWYARKGNAEEKTLKQLLIQQRNKIEEIKKKTNYYTTKNLLDRYDEGPVRDSSSGSVSPSAASSASGVQRRGPPAPIQSQLQHRGRPNGSGTPSSTPAPGQQQVLPQTPAPGGAQDQPFSPALPPMPPPRKQWYDKLADAILGDDTASTGPSPASRYALICERCFSHNGLVKEDQWEEAQYLCPKCGHFNPSARARKARAAVSPTSPQSALPNSAMSQGFPPRSTALSPSASASGHTPASSAAARRDPSPKSPLSASTVFVEKEDAEPKEEARGAVGGGRGEGDKTMHMEVDS